MRVCACVCLCVRVCACVCVCVREWILEVIPLLTRRLALGQSVVARGPELECSKFDAAAGKFTITFSNRSMHIGKGVVVPPPKADPSCDAKLSSAVTQVSAAGKTEMIPFAISGATLTVTCKPGGVKLPVVINGDNSECFLYGTASGLPAPPIVLTCGK